MQSDVFIHRCSMLPFKTRRTEDYLTKDLYNLWEFIDKCKTQPSHSTKWDYDNAIERFVSAVEHAKPKLKQLPSRSFCCTISYQDVKYNILYTLQRYKSLADIPSDQEIIATLNPKAQEIYMSIPLVDKEWPQRKVKRALRLLFDQKSHEFLQIRLAKVAKDFCARCQLSDFDDDKIIYYFRNPRLGQSFFSHLTIQKILDLIHISYDENLRKEWGKDIFDTLNDENIDCFHYERDLMAVRTKLFHHMMELSASYAILKEKNQNGVLWGLILDEFPNWTYETLTKEIVNTLTFLAQLFNHYKDLGLEHYNAHHYVMY